MYGCLSSWRKSQYLESRPLEWNEALMTTQIAKFMGATWGPPGSRWTPCWPHEPCYLGKFGFRIHTAPVLERLITLLSQMMWDSHLHYDVIVMVELSPPLCMRSVVSRECQHFMQRRHFRHIKKSVDNYRQVSNISRTKSQLLRYSRTVLWLSLPNPLKPDVKSIMKI